MSALAAALAAMVLAAGTIACAPPTAGGTQAKATPAGAGLVGRDGATLTRGGHPWRFVGFNDYQAMNDPGGYVCGAVMTDAQLDRAMAQVRAAGGDVLRTWWYSSYHRPGADPWASFDRVLDAAARHDVEVVPVLANQYGDCDHHPGALTLEDYQPGSAWYRSDRQWSTEVASHYAGDPTIAWWELVNEPEAPGPSGCDEAAATQALTSFATTMAAAVHAVDPDHLVDMGTIGTGQCGTAGPDYAKVSSSPGISICEYHDYGEATVALPDDGYNRLAQRLAQCASLHEPLVVGEAGIDAGTPCTTASLASRAAEFDAKVTAAFADGVVGYLPWELSTSPSCDSGADDAGHTYGIGPDDPTTMVLQRAAAALDRPPLSGRAQGAASEQAPPDTAADAGATAPTGGAGGPATLELELGLGLAGLSAVALRARARARAKARSGPPTGQR